MYTSVLVASSLVVLLAGSSQQRGMSEADREARGYQGGGEGLGGGQGGDSRYGFNIVDTDEKYGYEANYPGGRASFFLLGPNRGPGAQRGGYQQQPSGGYNQGARGEW